MWFALVYAAITAGYDDDSVIRDPQVFQCLDRNLSVSTFR
jgi:hypothetical protein